MTASLGTSAASLKECMSVDHEPSAVASVAQDIVDFGCLAMSHEINCTLGGGDHTTNRQILASILALAHEECVVALMRRDHRVTALSDCALDQVLVETRPQNQPNKVAPPRAAMRVDGADGPTQVRVMSADAGGETKNNDDGGDRFICLIRISDNKILRAVCLQALDGQSNAPVRTAIVGRIGINAVDGGIAVSQPSNDSIFLLNTALDLKKRITVKSDASGPAHSGLVSVASVDHDFLLCASNVGEAANSASAASGALSPVSTLTHSDSSSSGNYIAKRIVEFRNHAISLHILDNRGRVECEINDFGTGRMVHRFTAPSQTPLSPPSSPRGHRAEDPPVFPTGWVATIDNTRPTTDTSCRKAAFFPEHRQMILVGLTSHRVDPRTVGCLPRLLTHAIGFLSAEDGAPLRPPVALDVDLNVTEANPIVLSRRSPLGASLLCFPDGYSACSVVSLATGKTIKSFEIGSKSGGFSVDQYVDGCTIEGGRKVLLCNVGRGFKVLDVQRMRELIDSAEAPSSDPSPQPSPRPQSTPIDLDRASSPTGARGTSFKQVQIRRRAPTCGPGKKPMIKMAQSNSMPGACDGLVLGTYPFKGTTVHAVASLPPNKPQALLWRVANLRDAQRGVYRDSLPPSPQHASPGDTVIQ